MKGEIKLEKNQLDVLGLLRDLDINTIKEIITRLSEIDPPPILPQDLVEIFHEAFPERIDDANKLLMEIFSLYTLRRQRNLSPQDLLTTLHNGIKSNVTDTWSEEQIAKWEEKGDLLEHLFSLKSIWNVVKAMDLAFDYANLLQNAKIITDIRPVYNDDASKIQGAVISFSLRLYIDSLEGSKTLTISIDEGDIRRLLDNCKRALMKAETAKTFMQSSNINRVFVSGEEE